MPQDTQVNDLKINVLTEAQYEQIPSPSTTELYLVPDVVDTVPTSGSTNPITSGAVYTALQGIPSHQQRKTIVLRAIPANTALEGNKYFFSKNIKIKTKTQLSIDLNALNAEEDAEGQPRTLLKPQTNHGQTEGYVYVIRKDVFLDANGDYEHNDFLQHPCVVTIPQNFDAERFITDSEYRNALVKKSDYLCSKETASPCFKITNGYVICTKRLPVACGKPAKNKELQDNFINLLGISQKAAGVVAYRYKKRYHVNHVHDKTSEFQAMTDWRIGVYHKDGVNRKKSLKTKRTFDFAARHRGKRSIHVVTLFHKQRYDKDPGYYKHTIWTVKNMT